MSTMAVVIAMTQFALSITVVLSGAFGLQLEDLLVRLFSPPTK